MSLADTLQPAVQGDQAAIPAGRRLSEARQAQNLSAADVARQLKLSLWQVEALEAGRYQQLPGPIFVRGFIRNYARLVKLDPDELLRSAGDSLPQSVPARETPPSAGIPFPTSQPPRWPKYVAAAVVIFGALAAYEFVWNEPDAARAPSSASATPPPKLAARNGAADASVSRPKREAVMEQPAAPSTPPAGETKAVAPPEAAARPAPVSGQRTVKLVFREESWVEIRDARERILFSQLNRPGTTQEVIGLPPLSVVVGNSQGVTMTYDDQPVDLARHTKIDVARLTLE